MGIQDYQSQILNFFKKKFIEEEKGDNKELANVIRQRLMLIEDGEERKNLVENVLNEIHEITLIQKYKNLYSLNSAKGNNIPLNLVIILKGCPSPFYTITRCLKPQLVLFAGAFLLSRNCFLLQPCH